jgi:GNAT superfamily N-acetyltransferase
MAEYQVLERPFDTRVVSEVTALALDIFGEFDALEIGWRLASLPDATLQIARANTDLAAFKLGYAIGRTRYLSWLGGVASTQRTRGIARALMDKQHAWVRAAGYTAIETGTTKDNRAMLRLNLSAGFEVIGTYTRDSLPRVILQKRLGAA